MNWQNNISFNVQLISSQGTSGGSSAFVVPAGGSKQAVTMANVSQFSSYEIAIYALAAGQGTIAGTSLTIPVTLTWYDDPSSGIPVYIEEWDIWVAKDITGTQFPAVGYGPMHGQFLTVTIQELGGVSPVTIQYVKVFAGDRNFDRSNWRQPPPPIATVGLTTINVGTISNVTYNNILFMDRAALAINASYFIPHGLYAGQASWRFNTDTALVNNVPLVACDPRLITSGTPAVGIAQPGVIWEIPGTANNNQPSPVPILPRCPTFTTVHTSASGATIDHNLIGQEVG